MRKVYFALGLWIFVALAGNFVKSRFSIAVNQSPSIEGHFFLILKNSTFRKGDVVLFRFKGSKFVPKGKLLLKKVACVPGDWLEVRGRDFFCNGRFLGSALTYTCKDHKRVELFKYNGTIPEGKYFVLGESRCSYDSRYFGFVDRKDVIGKAILSFGRVEDE